MKGLEQGPQDKKLNLSTIAYPAKCMGWKEELNT